MLDTDQHKQMLYHKAQQQGMTKIEAALIVIASEGLCIRDVSCSQCFIIGMKNEYQCYKTVEDLITLDPKQSRNNLNIAIFNYRMVCAREYLNRHPEDTIGYIM